MCDFANRDGEDDEDQHGINNQFGVRYFCKFEDDERSVLLKDSSLHDSVDVMAERVRVST